MWRTLTTRGIGPVSELLAEYIRDFPDAPFPAWNKELAQAGAPYDSWAGFPTSESLPGESGIAAGQSRGWGSGVRVSRIRVSPRTWNHKLCTLARTQGALR